MTRVGSQRHSKKNDSLQPNGDVSPESYTINFLSGNYMPHIYEDLIKTKRCTQF
jgi:hypothetical protein